jgi:ribosome recycling factor
VRNVRRHAKDQLDKLAKDGDASEDDVRRAEKQLDELTAKHIATIDDVLKHKEAELLEV